MLTTSRLPLRPWRDEDLEPSAALNAGPSVRGMTPNPDDDFNHPNIAAGHPLRRHALYRLAANEWPAMRAPIRPEAPSAD